MLVLWAAPADTGEGRTVMWTFQGEKGREVHLLGSIHMAQQDLYPLPESIEQRFAGSAVLVVEADVTRFASAIQEKILSRGMYPSGERLEENISPKTRALLESRGVDMQEAGSMRPWLLAMTLQLKMLQSLGYEQQYGIDVHFLGRAAERGMDIVELETIEEQIELFATLSEADEDRFLVYALTEIDTMSATAGEIFRAWTDGNVEYLESLIFKTYRDNPALTPFFDALFQERNRKMARTVKRFLQTPGEDVFVVVGAGHLVGPKGIVSVLEHDGFQFQRH